MERIKLLAKFPIVATNRVEEAEFKLSRSITDLHITRVTDRRCFQLEMNGVNFGRSSLIFNRFGAETELETGPSPVESAIFVIGNNVPSRFNTDKKQIVVSPQKAAVVAPARKVHIERPENSELLILRVPISDLMHHFEKHTDRHHRGALIFEHNIDATHGPGSLLKRFLNYLANELKYNDLLVENPALRRSFDDLLLTALLSLPHNQRGKLYEDPRYETAPALVRRAEEYIRAHLKETITITDVLKICGCSRSVLFGAFKIARGYTPMEFLIEQRLLSAREKLLKPNHEDSVSSIAWNCGFINLGRFSMIYRKRFGERPSDTLRKGR